MTFIDTKIIKSYVFLYSRDAAEADKQAQAQEWLAFLWTHRVGRTSFQVLKEYYNVYTRELGGEAEQAQKDIAELQHWHPVLIDFKVFHGAWSLEGRFHLSWWDALVAAAAQIAGCDYLLTEDLHEGLVFDGVTVISPFRASPRELFGF
ncbi:MAG: PIN domain-containing protein [Vulcanimicrobiota bacterium]